MRVNDVCCGMGGLSFGFKKAGYEIEAGIDNWEPALDTYKKYIQAPGKMIDLSDYFPTKKDYDVIMVGGTPCQDFSLANKKRNIYGKRAQLVLDFCRIVAAVKPEAFVFENVIHLPRWAECAVLEQPGYKVTKNLVDSSLFGVPQKRRRKIFIGSKYHHISLLPPQAYNRLTVKDAFSQIEENWGFTKHRPEIKERFRKIQSAQWVSGTGGSYQGTVRLMWDNPSVAVTNIKKFYILHPDQDRSISLAEALALQGFPPWYIPEGTDTNKAIQIANAVPPELAFNIAKQIEAAHNG